MTMTFFSVPIPKIFGNYMLKDLAPIELPNAIALTPQTPIAKAFIAMIIMLISYQVFCLLRKWKKNKYRREALHHLTKCSPINYNVIPRLLKNSAMIAYPHSDVAGLISEDWIMFLNQTVPGKNLFNIDIAAQLWKISYTPLNTGYMIASLTKSY